jgi:uncharacterized protein (UPF0332 family)
MIDGNHFIQLAGKLATANPDEVTCRCAVSRAYYGAFHLALAFLRDLGIVLPANATAHATLQHYLIASGYPEARRAGTLLSDLHGDRIRADYRLDHPRFQDAAFTRLKAAAAHDFRSALIACTSDDAKAAIKASIEEFRRKLNT